MALTAFATVAELEAFWKPIASEDEPRAASLLTIASNRLRQMGRDLGVDVDAQFNDDEIYQSNLKYVVMEAVKRAMLTPQNQPPVQQFQQTAGPYSENYTYSNPSGDLWFRKDELRSLGLYGKQRLSSIITTREDLYS